MPNLVSVCIVSQALLTQDEDTTLLDFFICLGKSFLNPLAKVVNFYDKLLFLMFFCLGSGNLSSYHISLLFLGIFYV